MHVRIGCLPAGFDAADNARAEVEPSVAQRNRVCLVTVAMARKPRSKYIALGPSDAKASVSQRERGISNTDSMSMVFNLEGGVRPPFQIKV